VAHARHEAPCRASPGLKCSGGASFRTRLGPNSLVLRHDLSALRTAFCVRSSEPNVVGFPTRFAALGHRWNKQPPSRALQGQAARRRQLVAGRAPLQRLEPLAAAARGGAPALASRSGGSGQRRTLSRRQAGTQPSGRASPCVERGSRWQWVNPHRVWTPQIHPHGNNMTPRVSPYTITGGGISPDPYPDG
jgi:hypothetical protein